MVSVDEFTEEAKPNSPRRSGTARRYRTLGGVESSTAAALAYEAIGDQLTAVYVDTGLMRKGETDEIRETFDYMDSLRIVEAQDRFLDELEGETDPEEKRHVIGEQFIREFETVAREVDADYLVQGTIYPDRIESEGTIKSHHNVGGLPDVSTSTALSSRCGTSTRTRSARSPARLTSKRSSLNGCRSPVPGSPSESSGK